MKRAGDQMILKSREDGCQFLAEWLGVTKDEIHRLGWSKQTKKFVATYRLPKDSGEKTFLARLLVNEFLVGKPVTLVIQEHGVWQSSENAFLFITLRNLAANSHLSEVDDAPFLFFNRDENKLFESFFAITTYFYWDAVAVPEDESLIINTSHDEIFRVQTDDEETYQRALSCLSGFELLHTGL